MKTNGGPEAQAWGRSRGGFATQSHRGGLAEQTAGGLVITAGACQDAPLWEAVGAPVPTAQGREDGVMDKG